MTDRKAMRMRWMRIRPWRAARIRLERSRGQPHPTAAADKDELASLLAHWPAPRPPDAAFLTRLKRIPEADAAARQNAGTDGNPMDDLVRWWQDTCLRPLILGHAALLLVALIAGIVIGSLERRPVITLDVTPLITAELPLPDSWPEGRI